MKTYIGCKIIKAKEMSYHEFIEMQGGPCGGDDAPGYIVMYPDGYTSWSPKRVFEEAYREVSVSELKMCK